MTESVYEWNTDKSGLKREKKADYSSLGEDPLTTFLYALKSSEAKRQYPARLMKFFDYLSIENNTVLDLKDKAALKIKLKKQSISFLNRAKVDEKWALNSILRFIENLKSKQ